MHVETWIVRLAGKIAPALTVAALFCAGPVAAQPDPPLKKLPTGFTVATKNISPMQISIHATKPHNGKSCINVDPDMHLAYSWTAMPNAPMAMIVKSAVSQEERSSDVMGVATRPIGKERVKNGTLVLKQSTRPQIGTDCKEWVTYAGKWIGAVDGGLLIVSVDNVAGSKDNIKGWIDALIR